MVGRIKEAELRPASRGWRDEQRGGPPEAVDVSERGAGEIMAGLPAAPCVLPVCCAHELALTAMRAAMQEAPAPVGSENARHHMVVPKDATGPETHQNGPVRQWWTTARMHNVWYVS